MSNSSSTPSTATSTPDAPAAPYGFLRRPQWLALIAVAVTLAAVMVGLGFWQLSRYHERTAINERIDAAGATQPRPVTEILAVSEAPPQHAAWVRAIATGRYDSQHEILIRSRTVSGAVGYEVLTPLVLADGTAVLVDRGWIPPGADGAAALPDVPPAPEGKVTVIGRVRMSESGGDPPRQQSGRLQTRRINSTSIQPAVPHQVRQGYLLTQRQDPELDETFVTIPVRHEPAGQNLSYVIQWWLFAAIALIGPAYLIRREARQGAPRLRSDDRGYFLR